MKTERELFLYELKWRGYEFRNTDWHDDWERFEDDQLNMVWEMWLASKNREGYKLVPVEPTLKMSVAYEKNSIAPVSSLSVAGYKAMIGACDDH